MSDPAINGEAAAAEPVSERQGAAGAALLKERRRQGLSLGDISRQLKLSVRQVEALERDDYSAYKGPVFIHGFIRNYAKLLGLDPEPLIRATDAMLNPPQVAVPIAREPERVRPARTGGKKRSLWPAVLAIIVVGIAISIFGGVRRAPDAPRNAPTVAARDKAASAPKAATEPSKTAEAKPEAEVAAKPAAKPDAKPEAKPEARPEVRPAAKAEAKTEAKTESVERRVPAEAGGTQVAQAAETSARITVRMIFEQDSWVEIKDRSGNTIFGQLNPAGSRRSASGEPPLTVVVGNAAGVRLFQGDKSVDLGPHTRVDVARLTLE